MGFVVAKRVPSRHHQYREKERTRMVMTRPIGMASRYMHHVRHMGR